ncbi:aminopeptidase [Tenacibaculum sp. 190524A02b]|uniref:Aminopeptidase n=1 Tax=Tenacibaculum vairaonense TaxID=3137860 RepID=A0ABM9PK31_9FLAO
MLYKQFWLLFFISFFTWNNLFSQTNTIEANVLLHNNKSTLDIQQKIIFYNSSNTPLKKVMLHNWANAFKNNDTPLGKRFIEDYKKDFYFSKEEDRGYSTIRNLSVNYKKVNFKEATAPDIVEVQLNKPLLPKDSVQISLYYTIKTPNLKFTGYGKIKNGYHLRYWLIVPAIYQNNKWQTMSNLDIDDLYQDVANYRIHIDVPKKYTLESNLYQYKTPKDSINSYYLVGHKKKDVIINISTKKRFKSFKTKHQEIKTDAFSGHISTKETSLIINQQIQFIQEHIGKYPHPEIFVDANTVGKNSLHELYGIPRQLKPFPKNFRWEINFFKALCSKYIDDVLIQNQRKDYWFSKGVQTFLMMEYLKKYYPKVTLLGKYSKYWPIKYYNISKINQQDKFAFMYQFSARKFYDQALNISADSLSNFNRKIISQYKAGLGFRYLQDFIGDSILQKSLKEYLYKSHLKLSSPNNFLKTLQNNTSKDINWFINGYLKTNKKLDYKITKIKQTKNKDSLYVTIKNKRSFSAPVSLYGIKKKQITFKTWVTGVDSTKTVKIEKNGFNRLALNYENIYPEYNSLDNFRKTDNRLLNKPLQFRFFKDSENPYYNQLFYYPDVKYNLYDGVILGVKINNQPLIPHNFEFTLTPNYSTKSNNFTGSFSFGYNHFFLKSNIYRIRYGIGGSNFHYAPELSYNTLVPSVSIEFRRKTLRDVGSKFFTTRLFYIRKEVKKGDPVTEQDRYKVLNFRYIYNKPDIIKRLQYAVNLEIGNNFTKFSTDIRYRKFFDNHRSFDLRFFGGMFITNNSIGDYFSFGLNRSSDYLFEHNLFGRSENSGLFSQQFVISDAGFKSKYDTNKTANQFVTAINTSVSIWRWIEVYNDVAMLKDKNSYPEFFYENGIKLNFLPNLFEFYFPIYTNKGWEFNKTAYPSKIRFVITTNLDRVYNFFRRGLL